MAKKEPNLTHTYNKMRNTFGRQPRFCEVPTVLLESINPSINDQKQYGLRNPVNHETQTSVCISEHNINTKRVTLQNTGVNHSEGGWPKEVNCVDEELTTRHRRKIERDNTYVDAVLGLYPEFAHYINQNNAIDMYTQYFKGMPPQQPVEKSSVTINNVYKDPRHRPISCIEWTREHTPKMVVSYCNKIYSICRPINNDFSCFVWDIENPLAPYTDICPPNPCWQVSCSPTHSEVIIGGLQDGTVCIFDIRAKKEPTVLSDIHVSHREPVTSLLFMHSRANNEFFSGSTDGQCLWWDIRNISQPTNSLIMSIRIPPGQQISLENAEGVNILQYDKTLPTKFLCGTDTGFVINVNRKGKTYHEQMSATFQAHNGPVKSLHRSPCTSKVFITCGDWCINIWSDEVHTSPIITGPKHRYQISDVVWAPQRISSYMSIGYDGKFRYWDLLRKFREPVIISPISKFPLLKIKDHHKGKLVATGDVKGSLYLLSLSENLVLSGEKDKALMIQTLERETKREHILETRVKEIRLKAKADENEGVSTIKTEDYESELKKAEEQFRQIVSYELSRTTQPSTGGKAYSMRKR